MAQVPVIVISSSRAGAGKTTLALNLAAALWQDKYKVKLFAPDNEKISTFLEARRQLNKKRGVHLPVPQIISTISEIETPDSPETVLVADIPTAANTEYLQVFSSAHTLITVARTKEDIDWPLSDPYLNLIWNAKKNIAARGIKYLNWIVVENEQRPQNEPLTNILASLSRRYGFRVSPPLKNREAYTHINEGYCAADMVDEKAGLKMAMADVYARREILTLTDFMWQQK